MNADLKKIPAVSAIEMLAKGGGWLGCAREGLLIYARNGENLSWGSGDVIEGLKVRDYELVVANACAIAIREYLGDQIRAAKLQETLAKIRAGGMPHEG